MSKQPWTFWVFVTYTTVVTITSLVLWSIGLSYPKSGWFLFAVWAPLLLLWRYDEIKRRNLDVDYQHHMIKAEVQRAVRNELNKDKSLAKVVDVDAAEQTEKQQWANALQKRRRR